MNRKKLPFVLLLVLMATVQPACKHEQMDARKLYLKYLKSHSRNNTKSVE
ncbi:hypothetical protein [Pedobacter sp. ASV12]|nr:hypothetical protein [Pedobacter sp. ASV12]